MTAKPVRAWHVPRWLWVALALGLSVSLVLTSGIVDRVPPADLVLLYLGATLTAGWGVSHLVPTRSVVRSFGAISQDNKRILTMEWVTEGVSLIFIGLLVALVTAVDRGTSVSTVVYGLACVQLIVLALVSLFTGFKVAFLPFKLCPFIFTGSAALILVGSLL